MKRQTAFLLIISFFISEQIYSVNADGLSRDEIYSNFKEAFDEGDLIRARDWAQALVEAKEKELGAGSQELVISLINLAQTELDLQDWKSARNNALRAMEILDSAPDDSNVKRMATLMLLAQAHIGLSDEEEAEEVLNTASKLNKQQRAVDQIQKGDICELQVVVAKLYRHNVEKSTKIGNRAASCMLKAHESAFGEKSIEFVPSLHQAAIWFRFSTQLAKERKIRKQALEILEAEYGQNDPRLATDLLAISHANMLERKRSKEVENALLQAIDIEYPDTAAGTLNKALAFSKYGDFYLIYKEPEDGLEYYRKSWNLLANHPSIGAMQANDYFREVKELYFRAPKEPAKKDSKGSNYTPNGFVEVEFTVTELGTVEDVNIIRAMPLEMQENLFRKAYGRARYRPRIYMGEAVATERIYKRINYQARYEVRSR